MSLTQPLFPHGDPGIPQLDSDGVPINENIPADVTDLIGNEEEGEGKGAGRGPRRRS